MNTKGPIFIPIQVPKILLMQSYYYLFLITALSLIILLFRSFALRKKKISVELFVEALRDENCGHFEAAAITYKNALNEVKKNKFHDSNLKNKIIEKLKLLHTIIEYENSLHIIR
jgi:hypothetical protein